MKRAEVWYLSPCLMKNDVLSPLTLRFDMALLSLEIYLVAVI